MTKWSREALFCRYGDNWLVVNDIAYDISNWSSKHPGGPLVLAHFRTRDATDQVHAMHDVSVIEPFLKLLMIGPIEQPVVISDVTKAFRAMRASLEADGQFNTNISYYYMEAYKLLLLLVSAVLIIVVAGNSESSSSSIAAVLSGVLIAGFWHQLAFVAHDAGHNAITHQNDIDHRIGIFLASFLGGLSVNWWKDSHNIHHVLTNHPEHDPDIQHLPVFAVSSQFFDSLHSTYYGHKLQFDRVAQTLVKMQHWLYYPIMLIGRFVLYINTNRFLWCHPNQKYRRYEILGILCFWTWYIALVLQLRSAYDKVIFVFVSHALTFLLHIQITLSHFSMSTLCPSNDEEFVAHQLRTTMDVDCLPGWDWLHGGLQFQVEHHLFPRMPRHRLRSVRDTMIPFYHQHNLPYTCFGFRDGNFAVLRQLRLVARLL